MHAIDALAENIAQHFSEKISSGQPLILRDEKTLSGSPHIGSMRSASLHGFLLQALKERGIAAEYYYEINDCDAFDAVPKGMPESLHAYIGQPLHAVPSPFPGAKNYAEYFAATYCSVLNTLGFGAKYYRLSEKYSSGVMDGPIVQAIEKADTIREIYKKISGSEKPESWLPVQVRCPACGSSGATQAKNWNGSTLEVSCVGSSTFPGCGHTERVAVDGKNATLPWKVEWAAKWRVTNTDIEGAGKDHYAAGGSRLVANKISEKVFSRPHPFDFRHEFILTGEGAKMSSSMGLGLTAEKALEAIPAAQLRYLLVARDPMKVIRFEPDGDTIPLVFDEYDDAAKQWQAGEGATYKDRGRSYALAHSTNPPPPVSLPKFSQLAFISQLAHVDEIALAEKNAERALTTEEKAALKERMQCAKHWIQKYAPEKYKCSFADYTESAHLSETERSIVKKLHAFLEENEHATGTDVQNALHVIKEEMGLSPKEVFEPLYRLLLGKSKGPQLGFLLSSLPRADLMPILTKNC